ncbi:hypothetical protein PFICI_08234 [Pestalotiopsis fici W106-1]|uniref:Isotrichodermin C-15 hydroxylase n=1 Tax=Pestalotiopsis fici (strain W106-1 / CGMCC3.15140) TaxID=1229662 RepID=W3X3Q2_PESFW|nr:uncharacterized protein PFICI_08234 [Pestalotiopsis fici W106-1]ETS80705.1 hypothetical protein PFICI_08234 [Pestalotiopsis fici W106-1]
MEQIITMDGALRMSNLFVVCFAVTVIVWIIVEAFYNVFFHPLRNFPGPLLWRAFRLPYVVKAIQGRLAFDMLPIHEQYGPVVRIAPNELAFAHASAWRDIMGGKQDFAKWDEYYKVQDRQATNIMFAPAEEHAQMRRAVGVGFSDRVLRDMEPLIQNSIGLLIRRLRDQCKSPEVSGKIDMSAWFNFTTFDLIGNLVMGESYHCLENADYHPWVRPIFQVTYISAIMSSLGHYPWFKSTLLRLFRPIISKKILNHQAYTREKLEKRMTVKRTDLVEAMLDINKKNEMEMDKLVMNASVLIVAGSETTATVLSGVTYLLLRHPEKLARLTREVRSAFVSDDDITMAKASQLDYMLACLEETMRLYPPVPIGMPRIVPKGGRIIGGSFVPENTHVAIWHWALYRNPAYFINPTSFCPERFLGDPKFAGDERDILQPFHVGKRNCIGRSLAYIEMRLALARMLFNFDMVLSDESRDWLANQKAYNIWSKPPLHIRLSPRNLS